MIRHGHAFFGKQSRTYRTWSGMLSRCTSPNCPEFSFYGARGITVCDRWRKFDDFLADMGERPAGRSLDRIDNNGNYEPGNCRWATRIEQMNNTRANVFFEYEGRKFTLAQLAVHTGVDINILRQRLRRSERPWTVEGAVRTPSIPVHMRRAGICA